MWRGTSWLADPDRAPAELQAVPDHVVGERPGLAGSAGSNSPTGDVKGWWNASRAPRRLPLEQRPVDDPAEAGSRSSLVRSARRGRAAARPGPGHRRPSATRSRRSPSAAPSAAFSARSPPRARNFAIGERQPSPSTRPRPAPCAELLGPVISPSSSERGSSRAPALSPRTTPPPSIVAPKTLNSVRAARRRGRASSSYARRAVAAVRPSLGVGDARQGPSTRLSRQSPRTWRAGAR